MKHLIKIVYPADLVTEGEADARSRFCNVIDKYFQHFCVIKDTPLDIETWIGKKDLLILLEGDIEEKKRREMEVYLILLIGQMHPKAEPKVKIEQVAEGEDLADRCKNYEKFDSSSNVKEAEARKKGEDSEPSAHEEESDEKKEDAEAQAEIAPKKKNVSSWISDFKKSSSTETTKKSPDEPPKEERKEEDKEEKTEEKKKESKGSEPSESTKKKTATEQIGIKDNPDPVDVVKKEASALVGAEEYRALLKEILAIAPQINLRCEKDIFAAQTYLFSIGDGEGLTTCLRLLGKTVLAAGLMQVKYDKLLYETKLPFDTREERQIEIFEKEIDNRLDCGDKDRVGILCYDISEWIDHLTNSKFKDFLRVLEEHSREFIIVFRVPFVDKEVLARIQEALSDVLYVRSLSFPPMGMEEYHTLAVAELKKYGYRLDKDAWQYVAKRLSEEKSDGKFYGVKTLRKVLHELLYKKEVRNADKKTPSAIITKKDAVALCSEAKEDSMSAEELLNTLVGMEDVKAKIKEILSQIEFARSTDGLTSPSIHMRFVGNPGTGKTTVARILGKVLKEKGILRIGNFYEYSGRDFCGRYIGETAPKTVGMCRDAYGSVLFIDEAYSLYRGADNNRDFGREALDTLIAEMENHRDDLLVIMAGYPDEMNTLMDGNSGLKSRMPYTIEFKNFTREQLYEIFASMLKKNFSYDGDVLDAAKEYFLSLDDKMIGAKEFSNGRFVRNLFERTWAKAAMRRELSKGKLHVIKEDFLRSISDDEFKRDLQGKAHKRIGFGSSD